MAGPSKNLLIIDDDEETLELLSIHFKDQDFTFTTEADPIKGLELLDEQSFQAVLTDLDMPKMDGIDFIKRIKKRHANVTCHILSGRASTEEILEVINTVPVFSYNHKPWDRESLLVNLQNGFETHQLHRERDQLLLRSHKLNGELLALNHDIEKKLAISTRMNELSDLIHAYMIENSKVEEQDSLYQLLSTMEPLTFLMFEKEKETWLSVYQGKQDKEFSSKLNDRLVKKISDESLDFSDWKVDVVGQSALAGWGVSIKGQQKEVFLVCTSKDEDGLDFLNLFGNNIKRSLEILLKSTFCEEGA